MASYMLWKIILLINLNRKCQLTLPLVNITIDSEQLSKNFY